MTKTRQNKFFLEKMFGVVITLYYIPSWQPYSSTLKDMYVFQVFGLILIKRAMIGGLSIFPKVLPFSMFPSNS